MNTKENNCGFCGSCGWDFKDGYLRIFPKKKDEYGYLGPDYEDLYAVWPWRSFRKKVTKVEVLPGVRATCLDNIFSGFENCREFSITRLDTAGAKSMRFAFAGCSLFDDRASEQLKKWKVMNVEDMSHMFEGCTSLARPSISLWDTKSLKYAESMFEGSGILNTGFAEDWDMESAVNIESMFYDCRALKSIAGLEKWELRKLTCANYLFGRCVSLFRIDPFLGHLLNYEFSREKMFEGTRFDKKTFRELSIVQDDCFEFLESLRISKKFSAMDLLHGWCNVFAKALSEMTGNEAYTIPMEDDDGSPLPLSVHCFCVEKGKEGNVYIDVRGRFDMPEEMMEEFEDFIVLDEAREKMVPLDLGTIDMETEGASEAYTLSKEMIRKFREQYVKGEEK